MHALTSVETDAGVPVYAVPFTLTRVIVTNDVAGDTYAGCRARDDAVLGAGIVIVKRALVALAIPGRALLPPLPPEQPHSPSATASVNNGIRIVIFTFFSPPGR